MEDLNRETAVALETARRFQQEKDFGTSTESRPG